MGRASKKTTYLLCISLAMALMAATVPLAIWVTHLQTAQVANSRDRCQVGQHAAHTVRFEDATLQPEHVTANVCDTITFINDGSRVRLLAFGPHEHHISYDGISERALGPGQTATITLIKTGTYPFHDHLQDQLAGSFTVLP